MDEWVKVGELLKKKRILKKLLQEDIAKLLNVSIATYSCYERGVKKISIKNLKKACSVLDISIDEIVQILFYS